LRPTALRTRPSVSVVIPCYNYARFVGDAIASALGQDGVDVEVIVVDDASPDASADVVREIAAHDDRVRLIVHAENRGPVDTFNDGLAGVRGDYVVRLDADDLLTPGSLARATALAEAHPTVGLVYGHPLHFSGDVRPEPRTRTNAWTVWNGRSWLRARCRTGVNVITSPEVLMRRSVVDVVGGQRPLPHTHDMEMWLRIAAVSDIAYVHGADQAWHREHNASLSQSIDPGFGDIADRRDAFRTLFDWSGPHLPETDELRLVAERALADEATTRILHLHDRGQAVPALVAALAEFADSLEVESSPAVQRTLRTALARGGSRSARGTIRAVRRRVAREVGERRWHRDGVYHRA
jgi:glycosyltransferase involved in cell wall biosynthesis